MRETLATAQAEPGLRGVEAAPCASPSNADTKAPFEGQKLLVCDCDGIQAALDEVAPRAPDAPELGLELRDLAKLLVSSKGQFPVAPLHARSPEGRREDRVITTVADGSWIGADGIGHVGPCAGFSQRFLEGDGRIHFSDCGFVGHLWAG